MPYLFTCPHCQTSTQVEDRYSGQKGECVACGEPIQLPRFAAGITQLPPAIKQTKSAGWVAAAIVAVILLGCLLFALVRVGGQTMNRLSSNRERTSSMRNLERIADALNAYANDHGSYPPSFTRDASGRRMHSWRVLILPYLDEDDLYNRFDLSQAWDFPINMNAAAAIPSVYQHPNSGSTMRFNESAYYLVVGPGTLFPKNGPLGPDQVVDDLAQTILVIEGTPLIPSGSWAEPIDLDFAKIQGKIGSNPGIEPGGLLDDGVAFATADGRGHFLPNVTDPATVRALVTPRGGERLRDDTLD
ncbi:MAG: DUF1559 domain-containing protein [Rubripirellula sp.]